MQLLLYVFCREVRIRAMDWYHEPPHWHADGNTLTLTTAANTDFWRSPDGATVSDSGHFLPHPITGNFQAEVKVIGAYRDLYDQAGLMLRLDDATWLKCGIEFFEGAQHVSAVVTRDYSDWALAPLPPNPTALWLRLQRQGSDVHIHYSLDGATYLLLRHAYFPATARGQVGAMAASPTGTGFEVSFEGFSIT
jgi:regulation of enolase protein 1 (concanavalin A-like superfamily)